MRPLPLLLALTLASCTRPVMVAGDSGTRELAGRVAGTAQRCIAANRHEGLRVLDPRTLAYGRGPTIWVNRLANNCPGLTPMGTVVVHTIGNRYCSGDRVRGREAGAAIPGPSCNLNDWVPFRRR